MCRVEPSIQMTKQYHVLASAWILRCSYSLEVWSRRANEVSVSVYEHNIR